MAEALEAGRDEREAILPLEELAARLIETAGEGGVLFVARSERRASLIARVLRELAPSLQVLRFPAWDCVPYDRASPSRFVMGRRVATLRCLAAGAGRSFIVVATPEALAQRVPPRALWPAAELRIKVGDVLEIEALEKYLLRTGYVLDERVDEAGEAAIRGAVIDVFPAGAEQPVRLDHAEGRIAGIRRYDAASQRTLAEEPEMLLLPASEAVCPAEEKGEAVERFAGIEHFLADFSGPLETMFDYAAGAKILAESGGAERHSGFWNEVEDAYATRLAGPRNGGRTPPAPAKLYLDPAEWERQVAAAERVEVDLEGVAAPSAAAAADGPPTAGALGLGEMELRPGDAVIHIEHGMARLTGIESVAAGGVAEDALVLEFAGEAKLLVPAEDIAKIWRYGGETEAVTLDRLGGAAWPKRREALERDLAALAGQLVAMARERQAARATRIVPKRRDYERFADRFPFAETADQARAIADVLGDLASGRRMDRLVCGDVGFGKTEVALRGAAAVALGGKQVAVAAPTTVLVRQHIQTFGRRFAALGIEVAQLSRLVGAAEARAVKQALAAGQTRLVIGTQALAGKGIKFADLGLLIIDEEQRFGAAQKEKLRALGRDVHVLTLTATPIPRTLQWAMLGLQDVSVIATPPARRQPVRTFVTPFDPVSVRSALLRERRRGGQSFVVCPRIEDIGPMAARLGELVPELQVVVAHGKLPAQAIDKTMVDFADGIGDVLLATNIIESGLDVPRANTMLIWRADRFGLAQLHQLRGRVGRGRARGAAYLLTDPAKKPGKATEQRLKTLENFDRLGAGFEISGRDLDLRGAGDLLGEEQAGHLKLIGLGLYQDLLKRALAAARGEAPEADFSPSLHLGLEAAIPENFIPEPEIRINLHARLARPAAEDNADSLAAELSDRFGTLPEPVENLIALADLRRKARRLGVERLDAGPEAIAATFRQGFALAAAGRTGPDMEWRGERLVWSRRSETPEERRELAREFLDGLAGPAKRRKARAPAPEPV